MPRIAAHRRASACSAPATTARFDRRPRRRPATARVARRRSRRPGTCGPTGCRPTSIAAGSRRRSATSPRSTPAPSAMRSHAVAVAVDPETGHVEILDYVIVEDCGTHGQSDDRRWPDLGGAAQGIGTALYEESPYDANGQPLASTLRRLHAAGRDRGAEHAHLPHGDARRPTPSSASRAWARAARSRRRRRSSMRSTTRCAPLGAEVSRDAADAPPPARRRSKRAAATPEPHEEPRDESRAASTICARATLAEALRALRAMPTAPRS